jgi:hypothetical protein
MKRIAAGVLAVGVIALGAGQAAAGYTAQVQGGVLRINGDSASDTFASSARSRTRPSPSTGPQAPTRSPAASASRH